MCVTALTMPGHLGQRLATFGGCLPPSFFPSYTFVQKVPFAFCCVCVGEQNRHRNTSECISKQNFFFRFFFAFFCWVTTRNGGYIINGLIFKDEILYCGKKTGG